MGKLSDRIVARLSEMTPQLARGARFIVDHPDVMVMSSMREIAGRVGVAPATLLRLARMLGYEDWSQFRDVYIPHFRASAPRYAQRADELSKRQGVPGLVQEVRDAQMTALKYGATANEADAIDETAKILNRASRIFVASFLIGRAPGLTFTYLCRLFRSNVTMLGSEGTSLIADLADIRRDDAVLSINFLPYAREIHLLAATIARTGASLISIADSRATPLAPHAKSILLFAPQSPSFFPSITPAVALVESLAAAMMAHAGKSAVSRVGSIEKSLYSSGIYDSSLNPV